MGALKVKYLKTMKLHKLLLFSFFFCFSLQNVKAVQEYVYMTNGKLYFPDGKELSLWGVNFQPCLSWEYNGRFKPRGIALTSAAMKAETDTGIDELQRLGVNMIRVHLTPADFTDANGNLVQNVYLDLLDYMISEAEKHNMYVYLTFINHMGNWAVQNSIFNDTSTDYRQKWIFDKSVVAKSKTYISALINRVNPYTQKAYKSTPSIALFEIINEPLYYTYAEIQTKTSYYADFLTWINANRSGVNNAITYADYRTYLVQNYINDLRSTIRSTSAVQPVVWCCNWYNMRIGNEDVFAGISQSDAEVVSFCLYPGQNLVGQDYWKNPVDLSSSDYTNYFKDNYNNYNGFGWAKSLEFDGKAKVCYEFEQFFNQSSYLYPLMAQYLRSFGVQAAAMWTYNFGTPAIYAKGSHLLSQTCTPAKAASFKVAHAVFDNTALYTVYNSTAPNEQTTTNYALSKAKDLSMYVSADKFFHTGSVTNWLPFTVSNKVTNISGRGNSPLVQYNGSGIYTIQIVNSELFITLEPNYTWLMNPSSGSGTGMVTQLDFTTSNQISISLDTWGAGNYTLHSISGTVRTKVGDITNLSSLSLQPGKYVVTKNTSSVYELENGNGIVKWDNKILKFSELCFDAIKVYSFQGIEVLNKSIQNQNIVPLTSLGKGYFIVALSGKKNLSIKICKE